MTRSTLDGEGVFQDALFDAYRRLDTYDDSRPIGPLLFRIAHTFDLRVRAKGMAGAIWQGVRQARREHLKPRTHVRQARVTAMGA